MKRFINFGSIEQFRTVIKNISRMAQYRGQDTEGNAIMDRSAKLPTLVAIASEKIHGTNASVCFSNVDGFWVQSKNNIITVEEDNAECALFAEKNQEHWMKIIGSLADAYEIDLDENIISLYFEWSGGNIQKQSAVAGLDKRAIIFQHFKVSPLESRLDEQGEEESARWLETRVNEAWVDDVDRNIWNIMNFDTWKFEIDFEQALMSQDKFIKLVEETIEPNSPMGKAMGKEGNIGEGIVVTFTFSNTIHRFKVKGEKHSRGHGRVKKLNPTDEVFEQKKIDFVNNTACQEFRLEQAWQSVFGIGNEIQEPTVKATGDFLRAVVADVMKEESDLMAEAGLEPKDVNGMISRVARAWFMLALDVEAGIKSP